MPVQMMNLQPNNLTVYKYIFRCSKATPKPVIIYEEIKDFYYDSQLNWTENQINIFNNILQMS